jgi:hypothetical protein
VLKLLTHKNGLSSVASLTTEYQTASGSNISTITVCPELHEMGFHGRAPAHNPKNTMRNASVSWNGVKLAAVGLWRSGNAFSGMKNHISPTGSLTDKSAFEGCQENATFPNA